MSSPSLLCAVHDYLGLRRSFGYVLAGQDRPLADFARYLERVGSDTVTVEAALAWAVAPQGTAMRHFQRLAMVRGFATYLQAIDPRCEIPPKDLLPEGRRRVPPHIYSSEEIAELIRLSRLLRPSLRAVTTETVIGLLAVTGLRSGEVVRLDRDDVDLDAARLRIIATKFKKSREIALHPTAVEALDAYRRQRDRHWPHPSHTAFFVSSRGSRLSQSALEKTFAELVDRAGLVPPSGARVRRPRLHDMRHSFTVATLIEWHRARLDVQALLPALSAQLGHVDPASSYWYMTAVPELLAVASERVQASRAARP
ncbi:MAG TPA: tyrosine-type recombinase/integrase [Acidimicrobiales bacterium]|nr:tyrosine-type recombinase/integrase [Acidimicrobiales bacterium]